MFKRGMTRGQRILWRITRPFLVLWLFLEFFRSLIPFGYSLLPVDFRSFMFDDYIDLWRLYVADKIPRWVRQIPSWDAQATHVFLAIWGVTFVFLGRARKSTRADPTSD